MVFADATIPRNLIFGQQVKAQRVSGEPTVYSAILVLVSIMQDVELTAGRVRNFVLGMK